MNIDDAPYLDKNKDRFYDFYVIKIISFDEDNANFGTQEIIQRLTGYAINQWIFNSYLRYYHEAISYSKTVVSEYHHIRYNDFRDIVKHDLNLSIEQDHFIDMESVDLINETVFFNGNIVDMLEDYDIDFNELDEIFIPSFYALYLLITLTDYKKYFTADLSLIRKMIERICKVYIPVEKLLEYGGYEGEEWFLGLPDNVKVNITKEADFPKPMEQLSYFDIISYPYRLYHYLVESCSFSNSPEDG